jgi:hypothetical protein
MKSGITTLFINPIPRQSVQGRHQKYFINSTGDKIETKDTMAENVYKTYHFPLSPTSGRLVTGLNELVPNPYLGLKPETLTVGSFWRNKMAELVNKPQILKQTLFEIKFNREEGFYNDEAKHYEMRKRKSEDKDSYLQSFSILLYDRPNRFDDTTERGALAMQLAKVHGRIADSKDEMNSVKHHFYISEENEDELERNKKQDIINDAITDLTLLRRKQSDFKMYQLAIVLNTVRGSASSSRVKDSLNAHITDTGKSQMSNINKFNSIQVLMKGKSYNKFYIMYLIQQAINSNVISIREGHYVWHSKSGIPNVYKISTKYETVLNFFVMELEKYDEASSDDNWYNDLREEIRAKNIKVD